MRMRKLFLILFVLLITVSTVRSQETSVVNILDRAQPFFFDALNFANTDEFGLHGRLDLYVHIPFNIVQFVKKDEFYFGAYSITVLVTSSDGKLIEELSWERSLKVLDFERTNNPHVYDLSSKSLTLSPDDVIVEVVFEDKESQRKYRSTKSMRISDFDKDRFGQSDIMLVAGITENNSKRRITPQINPNMSIDQDGLHIYYEAYNPYDISSVNILYRIKRLTKLVSERSEKQALKKGINSFLTNVNSDEFSVGAYTIEVVLSNPNDTTQSGIFSSAKKTFVLEWVSSSGSPIQITNLDEAVEQLQYFAKSEEIDYIEDAPDEEEKRKRFEAFWERNNPVPGATVNKAMVEYYGRVAYANEHFSHFQKGWKSDRGMVFILYGPPSYIERHPSVPDSSPYNIWEYFDIGRRFTFVDYNGFGDYRLLYPIWDERNRLLN
jgi:GWxTD domain-containing protein